jgi:hypothetical protein
MSLHERWRGFRRSLRALAGVDAEIKRAHVAGRKRQLDTLARLRAGGELAPRGDRARDLLLLYTLERAADALAEGELESLAVRRADLVSLLETLVASALERGERSP